MPPRAPDSLKQSELASLLEHTLLRAFATQEDIDELCDEAVQHHLAAVAVNPSWTSYCAKRLHGSGVGVNTVVGFPLGANTAHIKVEEAREAARHGASELAVVINVGALKSGFPGFVEKELAAVVRAVPKQRVKVILETSYLSEDEKVAVCEMAIRAGAASVQTSTGYGTGGATVADVRLMRAAVGNALGVKAAGGVRTYREAVNFLTAGASRLGTSSSIEILEDMPRELKR